MENLLQWKIIMLKHPNGERVYMYFYCSVAKSCPTLCDPIATAGQVSLPSTISWSLLKLMCIE